MQKDMPDMDFVRKMHQALQAADNWRMFFEGRRISIFSGLGGNDGVVVFVNGVVGIILRASYVCRNFVALRWSIPMRRADLYQWC